MGDCIPLHGVFEDDGTHDGEHTPAGHPAGGSWAGSGYDGLGLYRHPFTVWRCVECAMTGNSFGSIQITPEAAAQAHARETRHIVQLTKTTTWIPQEKK